MRQEGLSGGPARPLVRADRLQSTANANGVNGDPARATAALGQLAVDAIITKTVAAIRKAEIRP